MENKSNKTISRLCTDVKLYLTSNKRMTYGGFIFKDSKGRMKEILVPVYWQIRDIYTQTKLTQDFINKLEYKIRLSLMSKPVDLIFKSLGKGEWCLLTPFKDIYEPITITHDGIKMGDNPTIINSVVQRVTSYEGKIFLECTVKELAPRSDYLIRNKIRNIKPCSDFTIRKLKKIDITKDFNSIYKDVEVRKKFKDLLKIKGDSKKRFISALSLYLEGKIIALEYDEHYGYTLWKILSDFVYGFTDEKVSVTFMNEMI